MIKKPMRALALLVSLSLLQGASAAAAGLPAEESLEAKRAKIDEKSREALDRLLKENEEARRLYETAFGYAVFSDAKISLGLSGSGGVGEAVVMETGKKVYMRMAGAGAAIGLGSQKYQVVFLFEDQKTFDDFVEKGWKAEGSANAVLGTQGASAQTSFTNGMAVFTLTEKGAMLQADLSGTKYWKSDKLNENLD